MTPAEYLPILKEMFTGDNLTDGSKVSLISEINRQWFNDLRANRLSVNSSLKPVIQSILISLKALKAEDKKNETLIRSITRAQAFLNMLDKDYSAAVKNFNGSGKSAETMLSVIKAHTAAGNIKAARSAIIKMNKAYSRTYPTLIREAQSAQAGPAQAQTGSGQIAKGDADELVTRLDSTKVKTIRAGVEVSKVIDSIRERLEEAVRSNRENAEELLKAFNEFVDSGSAEFTEFEAVRLTADGTPDVVSGWLLGFNTLTRGQDDEDSLETRLAQKLRAEHPNTIGLSSEVLNEIENSPSQLEEYIFHEIMCPRFAHTNTRSLQETLYSENYTNAPEGEAGKRDGDLTLSLKRVIGRTVQQDVPVQEEIIEEVRSLPKATVGIVTTDAGAGQQLISDLSGKYTDIEFVSGTTVSEVERLLENGVETRLLVDRTDIATMSENDFDDIVEQAKALAFARKYAMVVNPFVSGMSDQAISALRNIDNNEILNLLYDAVPAELSHNVLDSIIHDHFTGKMRTPATSTENLEVTPDESVAALQTAVGTDGSSLAISEAINKLKAFYANRDSDSFIEDLLSLRRSISSNMDKQIGGYEETITGLMRPTGQQALISRPQAIVLDARDPNIDLNEMVGTIKAYAATGMFYTFIIPSDDGTQLPKELLAIRNVNMIEDTGSIDAIREAINTELSGNEEKIKLNADAITVVTGEDYAESLVGRSQDPENRPNYLILGSAVFTDQDSDVKGRINRLIPSMAALNAMKRFTEPEQTPQLMMLQCTEKTMQFFRDNFAALYTLAPIQLIDIAESIMQYLESLTATQTSV